MAWSQSLQGAASLFWLRLPTKAFPFEPGLGGFPRLKCMLCVCIAEELAPPLDPCKVCTDLFICRLSRNSSGKQK
uniref:Putative secreted protein n=1 Tax=Ixodes scapularis TaxID=6945 RepID=A0A4D5RZC0_IXOSC